MIEKLPEAFFFKIFKTKYKLLNKRLTHSIFNNKDSMQMSFKSDFLQTSVWFAAEVRNIVYTFKN